MVLMAGKEISDEERWQKSMDESDRQTILWEKYMERSKKQMDRFDKLMDRLEANMIGASH